ncbi:MAG TPA: hypothetical protein VKT51_01300 [Candidatus Eremiobacteraceae bacterium]|nr:hypothetical protein [Candidatus Eremiobacteraceae bacterium]
MRSFIAAAAAGVCAMSLASAVLADSSMSSMSSMGKVQTVTGQVIDLACYTTSGAHGMSHAKCAMACAKAGGALGILTSDGNVLVSVEPKPGSDPNKLLLPYVEKNVTVTGTVYSGHGLSTIAISKVAAAAMSNSMMSH